MPTLGDHLHLVRMLTRQGVVRPRRPDRIARAVREVVRWGPTPAGGYGFNAAMYPDRDAIIDERGSVTFGEVQRRTNAIAKGLAALGVTAGDSVAVLCRNHRGWVESVVALSKLGAHALHLNTAFAAPQVAELWNRERPVALIHDEEFAAVAVSACGVAPRIVAWAETDDPGAPTLDDLAVGDQAPLTPPAERGRCVILTSGTTGTPKGADREQPRTLHPAAALLEHIPLRARERTLIAAPLFHSWGIAHFTLGMSISTTLVLRRRFDALETLRAVQTHRCAGLIVVPVMLQRLLDLPREAVDRIDTSSLEVIAASGSALPGELALEVMDRFGDVLYNLYGSTEVAWATIAGPQDLRAAPGTAGRAPRGTVVKLIGKDGLEVPAGATGRVYVGNELQMRGYTDGGNKRMLGALMAPGDVGRFDSEGRLFVAGRDDEMIVSGGENVFPREVEDLLAEHPAVHEAAIVGVADEQFGQRLRAFVVPASGIQATEEDIRAHVRANLAAFKVPRDVVFIEELPRTSTGKVIKRELAAQDRPDDRVGAPRDQ